MTRTDDDDQVVLRETTNDSHETPGDRTTSHLHRWPDPRPQLWIDWRRPMASDDGGHETCDQISQLALNAEATLALADSLGVAPDALLDDVGAHSAGDGQAFLAQLRRWCDDHSIPWVMFSGDGDSEVGVLMFDQVSDPPPGDDYAAFTSPSPARDALLAQLRGEIEGPGDGLCRAAERLASIAHAWQVDDAGDAYIGHPQMVAALLENDGGLPEQIAAGWLCDIVEHTWVTLDLLAAAGFPASVVDAVDALTRRDGEPATDHERRIASNPIAVAVERAKLAHATGQVTCVTVVEKTPDYENLVILDLSHHRFASLLQMAADSGQGATAASVIRDIIDKGLMREP